MSLDPTRTTGLRMAFVRAMRSRFRALDNALWQLIVEDDAFALVPAPTTLAKKQYRFLTSDQKLEAFNKWVAEQTRKGVLATDGKDGKPWTGKYVEAAYKRGRLRAFVDARGKGMDKASDFFRGTKAEFLRVAFGQPEQLAKVRLLATRAFEGLKGLTAAMATQLNRELVNGLLQGSNPKGIARGMSKRLGISRARAETIARTEIIHAHAEGQLDSFEDLGVDEVGAFVEWSTAGDDKVCPQCEALDGAIFTVKEARGQLPRHPNCRCAWIPAVEVNARTRRRQLATKLAKADKVRTSTRKRVPPKKATRASTKRKPPAKVVAKSKRKRRRA